MLAAQDGGIILLKKKVSDITFQIDLLNKSLTIKGAYGLTPDRAALFSTSDWKVEVGANIDHVNFDDIEFIGEDMAGTMSLTSVMQALKRSSTPFHSITAKSII